jgi:hypothetical protein
MQAVVTIAALGPAAARADWRRSQGKVDRRAEQEEPDGTEQADKELCAHRPSPAFAFRLGFGLGGGLAASSQDVIRHKPSSSLA